MQQLKGLKLLVAYHKLRLTTTNDFRFSGQPVWPCSSSSRMSSLVATGTVNSFINRLQPPLIEQKHTNNMEKHFLFLMPPHLLSHLKVGDWLHPWPEWEWRTRSVDNRQMTHAAALSLHLLPGYNLGENVNSMSELAAVISELLCFSAMSHLPFFILIQRGASSF